MTANGEDMIGYLKGKVLDLTLESALIAVNGVGYEVFCSGAAFSKLARGNEGEVYTVMQVKEDGISLYGFADLKEKQLFLRLTSVQGVGAKMALSLLSAMRPDELSACIASADVKRLSAVKGVGKKTADRIILELHGKISVNEILGGEGAPAAVAAPEDDDALSALMNLGFTRQESTRAVERARKGGAKSLEEIIAAALKQM